MSYRATVRSTSSLMLKYLVELQSARSSHENAAAIETAGLAVDRRSVIKYLITHITSGHREEPPVR
jgi:hypothetical protein